MKIISKIYIHPLTYLVIFISLLTGLFKELLTFLFIIIIHELGHITGALIYKWKIDKIVIMPFGGLTKFNELINKPLKEELVILILGPLFQLINFFVFKDISYSFRYYNYGLFIFNLLPIYPLDGYKLWLILLEYILPFKISTKIMLGVSFIFLILFLKLNFVYLLVLLFLLVGIIKEYKNIEYIFNRFLLERYTYKFSFKRRKIIKNIKSMYKDCYHLIKKDKLMTEKDYLKEKFMK